MPGLAVRQTGQYGPILPTIPSFFEARTSLLGAPGVCLGPPIYM